MYNRYKNDTDSKKMVLLYIYLSFFLSEIDVMNNIVDNIAG